MSPADIPRHPEVYGGREWVSDKDRGGLSVKQPRSSLSQPCVFESFQQKFEAGNDARLGQRNRSSHFCRDH